MKVSELMKGDILFTLGSDFDPHHSLIFIGGEKPICHSASSFGNWENPGKRGVFAQSTNSYSEGENVHHRYAVYRPIKPVGIGETAAKFAKIWTESSVPDNWDTILKQAQNNEWVYEFKTKFSDEKLAHGNSFKTREAAKYGEMTPEGIMKIAKAYASASDAGRAGTLHPKKGVTCTQFVHYCFQAACIELAIGRGDLAIPEAYKDRNSFKIKNSNPLVWEVASDILEIWDDFIKKAPAQIMEPLRVDTKQTNVGVLFDSVSRNNEFFAPMQEPWKKL